MSEFEKHQLKQNIEMMIDRSRFGSENFFTDSKTAASDILNYLQQQYIFAGVNADRSVNN